MHSRLFRIHLRLSSLGEEEQQQCHCEISMLQRRMWRRPRLQLGMDVVIGNWGNVTSFLEQPSEVEENPLLMKCDMNVKLPDCIPRPDDGLLCWEYWRCEPTKLKSQITEFHPIWITSEIADLLLEVFVGPWCILRQVTKPFADSQTW